MKLCADILYWKLKEEFKSVEINGSGSSELLLCRPEFYLDRTQVFEKNRVYVCSADHLPAQPRLNENVCLVCLEKHWNLTAYYGRCSVISVEADTDIFRVFNFVQRIFDRYEAWEEQLRHILRHEARLPRMIEASRDIFSNPMQLIGSDFRYLAVTDEEYFEKTLNTRLDTSMFDAEKMATFLSLHDLSTHVKGPLRIDLLGVKTLSVNIFDREEYLGCLTVFEAYRPFRESDSVLAVFLAGLLQQAIQQNPMLASTRSAVRRALRSVIASQPVDFELRQALSRENGRSDWVCVRLQPKRDTEPLPGAYLAAAMEDRPSGAMAFEFEGSVAAFLPAEQAARETTKQLLPILDRLRVVCGVSSPFSNLYEANHAWFQASAALQNGAALDSSAKVYYFQDYLLPQLLTGALAGRPSWVYYPEGLKRLKEHDENSQVSYLDTLRVYLDNNLSVTKTAAALYLHRSTLLDRLAHITRLLEGELKNPDFCLTLGILLRAELAQNRPEHPPRPEAEK